MENQSSGDRSCLITQPLAQPRVNRLDNARPFFTFHFYLFTKIISEPQFLTLMLPISLKALRVAH